MTSLSRRSSSSSPVRRSMAAASALVLGYSLLLLMLLLLSPSLQPVHGLVKELHYGRAGGGLTLECADDELIGIESEQLGYSAGKGCNPRPMCSVPYSQANWYCRGKSSCSGMPVERRPLHKRTCGSDFTNCLRVQYHCVKSKDDDDGDGDCGG